MKLRKMILTALFAALIFVATRVVQIPGPNGGYFNFGDSFVILSGIVLGPVYGMFAAGIGSALVDLLSPYVIYAPATLVIKGLMALVTGLLFLACTRGGRHFGHSFGGAVVGGAAAELIMILGYFLYETALYDPVVAFGNALTTNLPQAAVGLVAGLALFTVLDRSKLIAKLTGEQKYGV